MIPNIRKYIHNDRAETNYVSTVVYPQSSFSDYRFEVEAGKYLPVLDTDNQLFSGFNRIDDGLEHFTLYREGRNWLSLYIPSRTAVVLQLQEENFKMKK